MGPIGVYRVKSTMSSRTHSWRLRTLSWRNWFWNSILRRSTIERVRLLIERLPVRVRPRAFFFALGAPVTRQVARVEPEVSSHDGVAAVQPAAHSAASRFRVKPRAHRRRLFVLLKLACCSVICSLLRVAPSKRLVLPLLQQRGRVPPPFPPRACAATAPLVRPPAA